MKNNVLFKKIIVCVLFLLSIGLVNAQTAKDYFTSGVGFYKNRQYDSAISNLNKAIGLDPNFTNAYITRGNSYYSKRLYNLAKQDYNKAINLMPNSAINFYN